MNIEAPKASVTVSRRHDFLYDPKFHPDRAGQVAMQGWHAEAICEAHGIVGLAVVTVGLDRQGCERSAIELAESDWISKAQAKLNQVKD